MTGHTEPVPHGHERTYVKVALERIADACREAAGYQSPLAGHGRDRGDSTRGIRRRACRADAGL